MLLTGHLNSAPIINHVFYLLTIIRKGTKNYSLIIVIIHFLKHLFCTCKSVFDVREGSTCTALYGRGHCCTVHWRPLLIHRKYCCWTVAAADAHTAAARRHGDAGRKSKHGGKSQTDCLLLKTTMRCPFCMRVSGYVMTLTFTLCISSFSNVPLVSRICLSAVQKGKWVWWHLIYRRAADK